MLKRAATKALWAVRGLAFFWGAVFTLALFFGVGSMALGANGKPFLLGKNNLASALTKLTANTNGQALQIQNTNPGANDSALNLTVQQGEAPMRVNSDTAVANLNADKVDGRSFSCPAGTLFHEGACIELTKREPASAFTAEQDCLGEGRRLPTVAELQTFRLRAGTDFDLPETTSARGADDSLQYVVQVGPNSGETLFVDAGREEPYRCAVPPS